MRRDRSAFLYNYNKPLKDVFLSKGQYPLRTKTKRNNLMELFHFNTLDDPNAELGTIPWVVADDSQLMRIISNLQIHTCKILAIFLLSGPIQIARLCTLTNSKGIFGPFPTRATQMYESSQFLCPCKGVSFTQEITKASVIDATDLLGGSFSSCRTEASTGSRYAKEISYLPQIGLRCNPVIPSISET